MWTVLKYVIAAARDEARTLTAGTDMFVEDTETSCRSLGKSKIDNSSGVSKQQSLICKLYLPQRCVPGKDQLAS